MMRTIACCSDTESFRSTASPITCMSVRPERSATSRAWLSKRLHQTPRAPSVVPPPCQRQGRHRPRHRRPYSPSPLQVAMCGSLHTIDCDPPAVLIMRLPPGHATAPCRHEPPCLGRRPVERAGNQSVRSALIRSSLSCTNAMSFSFMSDLSRLLVLRVILGFIAERPAWHHISIGLCGTQTPHDHHGCVTDWGGTRYQYFAATPAVHLGSLTQPIDPISPG